MKKILFITILLLNIAFGFAQRANKSFFIKGGVGALQYYGDLSNKFINLKQSTLGYHSGIGFQPNSVLGIELCYLHGTVKGDDRASAWLIKNNPNKNPNYNRSLNFKTDIKDLNLKLYLNFDNGKMISKYAAVAPYFIVGFGVGKFTPYADLLNDNGRYYYWTDGSIRDIDQLALNANDAQIIEKDNIYETNLANLNLEKDYKQWKLQSSLGFGLNFKLTKFMYLYLQTEWTYNFTDFIDDVSNGKIVYTYDALKDYAANPANAINRTRSNNNNKIGDNYLYTSAGIAFYFGKKKSNYITINTKNLYNNTYGYTVPRFLNDTNTLKVAEDSLEFNLKDTILFKQTNISIKQPSNKDCILVMLDTINLNNNKKLITKKVTTIYNDTIDVALDSLKNDTLSFLKINTLDSLLNMVDVEINNIFTNLKIDTPIISIQNDSFIWIQVDSLNQPIFIKDSSSTNLNIFKKKFIAISADSIKDNSNDYINKNIIYLKTKDTIKYNTLDSLKIVHNKLLEAKQTSTTTKDTTTLKQNSNYTGFNTNEEVDSFTFKTNESTINDTTVVLQSYLSNPNINFLNKLDSLKNDLNMLNTTSSKNKKNKKNKSLPVVNYSYKSELSNTTKDTILIPSNNNIVNTPIVSKTLPTTDTVKIIQYNTPTISSTFPNTNNSTTSNEALQSLKQNDEVLNQKLNEIYNLLQQKSYSTPTNSLSTTVPNNNYTVPSNYIPNNTISAVEPKSTINTNNALKDSVVQLQNQLKTLQQENQTQQAQITQQLKSMQQSDSLMFKLLEANTNTQSNNTKKQTNDVLTQNQLLLDDINTMLQQYHIKSIDTPTVNNQTQLNALYKELDNIKTELKNIQTSVVEKESSNTVNPNKETLVLTIYFGVNKTNIDNEYTQQLNDIVNLLNQNTKLTLLLKGYADATGNVAYNKKLSVERTQSVKDFFILLNGINYYRINEQGFGEDFANIVGDNQHNRRVDIYIVGSF